MQVKGKRPNGAALVTIDYRDRDGIDLTDQMHLHATDSEETVRSMVDILVREFLRTRKER